MDGGAATFSAASSLHTALFAQYSFNLHGLILADLVVSIQKLTCNSEIMSCVRKAAMKPYRVEPERDFASLILTSDLKPQHPELDPARLLFQIQPRSRCDQHRLLNLTVIRNKTATHTQQYL